MIANFQTLQRILNKKRYKTSGPVESSNANFFVKRALTKPLLWRMIEVSDSYLARLTALTFPMADGPFGMWVQLVLQHACNSGDLEGKFPLDPLSREKSRPQAAHGIQQPRQLMYDGMTPCPHLIPSEPSPWCHGAAPERRSVILSQRQLWWPHALRDRNSVQQCASWWHPICPKIRIWDSFKICQMKVDMQWSCISRICTQRCKTRWVH